MTTLPEFTMDEVGRHSTREDMWIVVDNKVFNLSGSFANILHPGGE